MPFGHRLLPWEVFLRTGGRGYSRAMESQTWNPHARPARNNEIGDSGIAARHYSRGTVPLHPRRLLLSVAEQSGIGDQNSCRIILSILSASRAVRRSLCREMGSKLGFQDTSGTRFAALVTLYALSPLSATASDLAYHADASRASMTDVIASLEQRGLVARESGTGDRITHFYLTELGLEEAVLAVQQFLTVAQSLAGGIGAAEQRATLSTCEQLETRASGASR